MEREVCTRLEWVPSVIHSYVEEVRAAAMSYIKDNIDDDPEKVLDIIVNAIKEQIEEIERFSGRIGDTSYDDILQFENVYDSQLDSKYLEPITNLCIEYKRSLISYLSGISKSKVLEEFPSVSASILILIADVRSAVM